MLSSIFSKEKDPAIAESFSIGMDLRGVEPLSESPFIKASPITVSLLAFPRLHAERQAYKLSSFIVSFAPAKLKEKSASQFMIPGS